MYSRIFLVGILLSSLLFAQPRDSIIRVGACATPGICWNVVVRDSFAYIADYGRVTVVNWSDPSNPWVVSSLNSGPPVGALGITVQDTVAYCNLTALGSVFITVSIGDPESLYILGECWVPPVGGPDPTGVSITDTLVYLANGDDGLGIINVATPSAPETIRYYDTPGFALDIVIKDTLVYIADMDSLLILNISNPLSPFQVGSVDMPTGCYGVFVESNYAYVTCQSTWGNDGRLEVVNIVDPTSPLIISSVNNICGDPADIYILDSYAYVAAADFWFPPRGRKQVGGLKHEWTFGKRADVEGGLRVIDISNPLNPELVASYDTPGNPRGVFAVDTLVFVADYDSLQILRHSITGIKEANNKHNIGGVGLRIQPNPFRHKTKISYTISSNSLASVRIYDVQGRKIKDLTSRYFIPGCYDVVWNGDYDTGHSVPEGVYFVRLKTPDFVETKKVLLLK